MRLALAQINPTVGDLPGNAQRIAEWIDKARATGADLVVLPELCLCGYPPKDLLLMEGFIEACGGEARRIGESATQSITVIFGCPLPADRGDARAGVANSLLVYRDNKYLESYHKRLLPTYDVFDENRYFTPGDRPVVIEVKGVRVGLSICEDLWKGEDAGFAEKYRRAADPVAALHQAGGGVDLLVSPSASPFVLGKGLRHREILRRHASERRWWVASVNQVGGNDDLVFDGHAAVYGPDGALAAAAGGFAEDVIVFDIPARASTTPPGRPSPPDPLTAAPAEEQLFRALVLATRDYVRKTGHTAAIIGLSGGIDSAVTAAIAVAALGRDKVLGVSMPGPYSSEHSRTDARKLAERLWIECITIPIEAPLAGFRQTLDPAFEERDWEALGARLPDITEENLQSRARGTTLMALSNRSGSLVLTTGNKSELAVGYATLYGDMNGGYAVLCDVSKMQVYALAAWMNANFRAAGFSEPPIPEGSIIKPPSAELRPNQTDQDSLPPYRLLDAVIERYVERHESPARIARETGIEPATVNRVVGMIDRAEYKRKQLALGPKVTTVAFGTGRRFPIAQRWKPT